jgi:hypothetical protein
MPLSLFSVSLLFASLGLFSHLGYFIYGEHHMQSVRILSAFALGPPTIFSLVLLIGDIPVFEAIKVTAVALTSFFLALTVSILSYRMWFHPLRHFPGPLLARLAKFTHSLRLLARSDNFAQTDQLHQKFGNIVRQVFPHIPSWIPNSSAGLNHSYTESVQTSSVFLIPTQFLQSTALDPNA